MDLEMNIESEVNMGLEKPIIDIQLNDIQLNSKKKFFSRFSFLIPKFRVLNFLYRHKNLKSSLPIAKRNTGLFLKNVSTRVLSIKSTLEQLLKTSSDGLFFFQSLTDELILNKIRSKYINPYLKISPYFSQSFLLLPVVFIYSKIDDQLFEDLQFFQSWRILYLWKYPIRAAFSAIMSPLVISCPIYMSLWVMRYGTPAWFYIKVRSVGSLLFVRRLTLCIALCAEIFGETIPNEHILVKPLITKVAKKSLCNTTALKNLQRQRHDPKNLPLLDLMLEQDVNSDFFDFDIELDIIPNSPLCIDEKSLQKKLLGTKILGTRKRKTLEYRQKLRIKSESQAKTIRNSITRILLF